MDDRQMARVLGDVIVLHRRVAAADHDHPLSLEESTVADSAGRDAPADQLRSPGCQPARLGAHREDHALRSVFLIAEPDPLDLAVGKLDAIGVVGDEAGSEALRLSAELLHHLRPHDPSGITGVVLDVGGVLKLSAPVDALDHERLEIGARRIQGGRVAGRPTADDDQFFSLPLAHFLTP
jgi:hypothetical protein